MDTDSCRSATSFCFYLMMAPSFYYATGSFLDGTGKNKSLGVHIIYQVLQPSELQPGYNGKDDIAVSTYFELAGQKSPLPLIYGDTPAEFVDELKLQCFAFS